MVGGGGGLGVESLLYKHLWINLHPHGYTFYCSPPCMNTHRLKLSQPCHRVPIYCESLSSFLWQAIFFYFWIEVLSWRNNSLKNHTCPSICNFSISSPSQVWLKITDVLYLRPFTNVIFPFLMMDIFGRNQSSHVIFTLTIIHILCKRKI